MGLKGSLHPCVTSVTDMVTTWIVSLLGFAPMASVKDYAWSQLRFYTTLGLGNIIILLEMAMVGS